MSLSVIQVLGMICIRSLILCCTRGKQSISARFIFKILYTVHVSVKFSIFDLLVTVSLRSVNLKVFSASRGFSAKKDSFQTAVFSCRVQCYPCNACKKAQCFLAWCNVLCCVCYVLLRSVQCYTVQNIHSLILQSVVMQFMKNRDFPCIVDWGLSLQSAVFPQIAVFPCRVQYFSADLTFCLFRMPRFPAECSISLQSVVFLCRVHCFPAVLQPFTIFVIIYTAGSPYSSQMKGGNK